MDMNYANAEQIGRRYLDEQRPAEKFLFRLSNKDFMTVRGESATKQDRNDQTKVVSISDEEVAYILQPTAGVSRGAANGDDTRYRIRRSHEILKAHGHAL